MTGTHNKTEQPKPAAPSVVIRILASLENGSADAESVEDYRRHLSRHRAELVLAVAVLERVCRIDPDGDGVVPRPKIMAILFIPILPGTHGNELGQVVT
jgi:hypothetical protein